MVVDRFPGGQETAVLISGGLDSAVLLAQASQESLVYPIYVSTGLAWEPTELAFVSRFLEAAAPARRVSPLTKLAVDMRDIYPASHWAVRGAPPAFDTPDEEVYLEGRNLVLLSKAAVFCARHGIHRIAMGLLTGNPFPDATPEFFDAIARALSLGLAHDIRVTTPLAGIKKADVIKLGAALGVPLELTLSCMNPAGEQHCGRCSKCRERRDAFHAAGVADPTRYATRPPR